MQWHLEWILGVSNILWINEKCLTLLGFGNFYGFCEFYDFYEFQKFTEFDQIYRLIYLKDKFDKSIDRFGGL